MPEEEQPEEDYEEAEAELIRLVRDFLRDNQEPIGKLIKAYAGQVEKRLPYALRSLIAVLLVTVAAFIAASLLGWASVISGDAVAFLFGSLIAYLFAFLKERFPF